MWLLQWNARLRLPPGSGAEAVSDLLEVLLDHIDERGMEPDVGATLDGDRLILRVEIRLAADDAQDARTKALRALGEAFARADVEGPVDVGAGLTSVALVPAA